MNLHYLNRYNKLIFYYSTKIREDGYYEKHHIIPKCLNGTDDLSNLILLPPRVHFIAHYLLYKVYPDNNKLAHAFAMMAVNNPYQSRSSKLYELSKVARSNALKGIPRPEWVKQKMRKPKYSKNNYQGPKTKDHANNISKALKGKSKPKINCPHCNKIGYISNMKRWHFNNCKHQ
jgi:hypothetical protein